MPAESVARYLLTVVLAGADLAASAWQQDGVGARGLGTLGLDVLAADPAHYSPLLVDLKLILLMKSISTEDDLTVFKKQI